MGRWVVEIPYLVRPNELDQGAFVHVHESEVSPGAEELRLDFFLGESYLFA